MTDTVQPLLLVLACIRAAYHQAFHAAVEAGVQQDALAADLCEVVMVCGALLDQQQVEL